MFDFAAYFCRTLSYNANLSMNIVIKVFSCCNLKVPMNLAGYAGYGISDEKLGVSRLGHANSMYVWNLVRPSYKGFRGGRSKR